MIYVKPKLDFWTDDVVERLQDFVERGWSAGLIAQELGTTRNAVTGKVHRLGLTTLQKPTRQIAAAPPKPRPIPATRPPKPKPPVPATAPVPIEAPEPVDTGDRMIPVPFMERRLDQCAAILPERGSDGLVMFCGEPTVGTTSWCQAHFLTYTEPPKGNPYGETRQRDQ